MPKHPAFSVPDALTTLDTAIAGGTLARGRRANGTDGLDMMSVFVPEAWVHGAGPGDGTWMSAFLDRGWPEWLVMLGVSLFMNDAGATRDRVASLAAAVGRPVDVSSEDADAFLFARSFARAISAPFGPTRALHTFLRLRLGPGRHSVLASLTALDGEWEGQVTVVRDALAMVERRLAGEELERKEVRTVAKACRAASDRAALSGSAEGAYVADLCGFAGAAVHPYGDVVLLALGRGSEVGPGSRALTASCRDSLLAALRAAAANR